MGNIPQNQMPIAKATRPRQPNSARKSSYISKQQIVLNNLKQIIKQLQNQLLTLGQQKIINQQNIKKYKIKGYSKQVRQLQLAVIKSQNRYKQLRFKLHLLIKSLQQLKSIFLEDLDQTENKFKLLDFSHTNFKDVKANLDKILVDDDDKSITTQPKKMIIPPLKGKQHKKKQQSSTRKDRTNSEINIQTLFGNNLKQQKRSQYGQKPVKRYQKNQQFFQQEQINFDGFIQDKIGIKKNRLYYDNEQNQKHNNKYNKLLYKYQDQQLDKSKKQQQQILDNKIYYRHVSRINQNNKQIQPFFISHQNYINDFHQHKNSIVKQDGGRSQYQLQQYLRQQLAKTPSKSKISKKTTILDRTLQQLIYQKPKKQKGRIFLHSQCGD